MKHILITIAAIALLSGFTACKRCGTCITESTATSGRIETRHCGKDFDNMKSTTTTYTDGVVTHTVTTRCYPD